MNPHRPTATVVAPALAVVAVVAVMAVALVADLVTLAARPRPATAPAALPSAASPIIVLAELFTSEGCSSCPAADDLLREWLATQPVAGVQIVALGEHVDYWDRLGWRDPFSSPEFSARQSAYDAAVFRDNRVYTPQLVVDGRYEAIGSDAIAVRRAVGEAARAPKAAVEVFGTVERRDRVQVRLQVSVPPAVTRNGTADVVVAVTEDGLVTKVRRGENGGRTLRHAAVTRTLTTVGAVDGSNAEATVVAAVPLHADWSRSHLRVVAFLQERAGRRILGVGTAALAPVAPGR